MKISVVCSSQDHPIFPLLQAWRERYSQDHDVDLLNRVEQLQGGDLLLLVSCSELVSLVTRQQYRAALALHASDLPQGRGWSPHIWQVLEGKEQITVTLLEAEDKVDTGAIWAQTSFSLEGHELYDEINQRLFTAELELMDYAVDNFETAQPRQQPEVPATYYRKREPDDSRIDPERPLVESFNQLRVADPNRYPAFFYHRGQKYTIRLEKSERDD